MISGGAWQCLAWQGAAWQGAERQGILCPFFKIWRGVALHRRVRPALARSGSARQGTAGIRLCIFGGARHGGAVRGSAWRGLAWCGPARHGRDFVCQLRAIRQGPAVHGQVGLGLARERQGRDSVCPFRVCGGAWQCPVGLGPARQAEAGNSFVHFRGCGKDGRGQVRTG